MGIITNCFLRSDDIFSGYSSYFSYPEGTEEAVEKTAEKAASSSNGLLYVLLGAVGALLIAGIVIVVIRLVTRAKKIREKRNRELLAARAGMPAAPFGVQQTLPTQTPLAQTLTVQPPAVTPAGYSGMLISRAAFNTQRPAAEIPGETLPMLTERVRTYLESCGVIADATGLGHAIAAYAASGSVKLDGTPGTQPALVAALGRLLSNFFGETPGAVFTMADNTTPEYLRTEVEVSWASSASGSPYCGIGCDTFRGILRETEEEFFLPEEDWRRADKLLERCAGNWMSGAQNRLIRKMETLSSCLMATGASCDEALDRALSSVLLPGIFESDGAGAVRSAVGVFGELFANRNLPLSRRYLQTITI